MDCLTQNQQPHKIKYAPNACQTVPLRWLTVLHMHLAGRSNKEIAAELGYSLNSTYRILNHKDTQYVRQQLMQSTQQEFEALFNNVVDAVKTGLKDLDPKVQLSAASLWLKSHGKIKEADGGTTVNVTAEDVVFQILNQSNQNDE